MPFLKSIWCHRCLCSLLVALLLKMASKHSANVLPAVRKCKKAVVCHMEKILLLEKLRSGMGRAVGCEFNVNKSTKYIK